MRSPIAWPVILVALLAFVGCRTYGGYDAASATYTQIERSLDRFEEDLARAQGDLEALEAASPQNPALAALTAQYARLVEAHEAVLAEHRDMAAALSAESTYRTLHRTYGALVSEEQLIRLQYQGVLRYVYDAYSPEQMATAARERPYALVPPYYARASAGREPLTVRQVVQRVRSGSARTGVRIMMPPVVPTAEAHPDEGSGH